MSGFIGFFIGIAVGVFGFFVLRNPYVLSRLSRGSEGYYQRLVLDTLQRNQLRVLGVLVGLFGCAIATACLASLTNSSAVQGVSNVLLLMMTLMFFGCFIAGICLALRQLSRGELFDWWRMWKAGAQLGVIEVVPPITPKMQKEATLYTYGFCALLSIAIVAGVASSYWR